MNLQIHNRKTLAPRQRSWQQIEVAGHHPARLGDESVVQVIDADALAAIAAGFPGEREDPHFDGVLVDADRLSHDPAQRTEAFAWLMNVEVRDGQLWGELEWTGLGARALNDGTYKYFSTEYDAGDLEDLGEGPGGVRRVRPRRLAGLALTNRPNNQGGRQITNRSETGRNPSNPDTAEKNIAEKLGLPAEATEEEILAAIGGLQDIADEAEGLVEIVQAPGRYEGAPRAILRKGLASAGEKAICPSTSLSRSAPGATSARRSPSPVSSNTARSVT